jgi:hypothetical protein
VAQQLPDSRRRERCLPVSEKLLPGEGWAAAVTRALTEELGSVLEGVPGWQDQVRGQKRSAYELEISIEGIMSNEARLSCRGALIIPTAAAGMLSRCLPIIVMYITDYKLAQVGASEGVPSH